MVSASGYRRHDAAAERSDHVALWRQQQALGDRYGALSRMLPEYVFKNRDEYWQKVSMVGSGLAVGYLQLFSHAQFCSQDKSEINLTYIRHIYACRLFLFCHRMPLGCNPRPAAVSIATWTDHMMSPSSTTALGAQCKGDPQVNETRSIHQLCIHTAPRCSMHGQSLHL